jgi:hypothetical protein
MSLLFSALKGKVLFIVVALSAYFDPTWTLVRHLSFFKRKIDIGIGIKANFF